MGKHAFRYGRFASDNAKKSCDECSNTSVRNFYYIRTHFNSISHYFVMVNGTVVKSVCVRLEHADIFHNKCSGAQLFNGSEVLFYQYVIHADYMIFLAICI